MDFEKMIVLFLDYCSSKQLRPKTMLAYERTLKLFYAWLKDDEGVTKVEQVKESTLRRYIISLQTRGKYTVCGSLATMEINFPQRRRDYNKKVGNITINNYLRNLRVFFTWLEESECIVKSPMRRIRSLPAERPAKDYLEDEEVKRLLAVMDKSYFPEYRDMLVTMIMLDSGTRLGETLSIEMEQLNLIERTIHLPAEKTKGRAARTVFFSLKTEKELRRWLQYKDRYCESPYVFPIKSNGRMLTVSNFEGNFRNYVMRAGIKKHVSPHTMRNNFAKRCLLGGMDIYTLSRILGHSSVKVTEKAYLDVTDVDLKKRYNMFSPLEEIYYKQR